MFFIEAGQERQRTRVSCSACSGNVRRKRWTAWTTTEPTQRKRRYINGTNKHN